MFLQNEDIDFRLKTYKKFLFVREPMERLVSAYKNKILGTQKDGYVQSAKEFILRTYRKLNNFKFSNTTDYKITFREFANYVTIRRSHHELGQLNQHWRPYTEVCHPCVISYDYIGRYETLEEDAEQILRRVGAPRTLHFPPFVQSKSKSEVTSYLDELSASEKKMLFSIYSRDYTVFGYPHPEVAYHDNK